MQNYQRGMPQARRGGAQVMSNPKFNQGGLMQGGETVD